MTRFSNRSYIAGFNIVETGSTPVTPTTIKAVDITAKSVKISGFSLFLVLHFYSKTLKKQCYFHIYNKKYDTKI